MEHHRFVRMALGLVSVLFVCAVTVMPVAAGDDGDDAKPAAQFVVAGTAGSDGDGHTLGVEWTLRYDRESDGIVRPLGVEWTRS
jgi:hypothetical protein